MSYLEAQELQRRLITLRYKNIIDDILLLLEHPPTITLGRFANPANILVAQDELNRRGISIYASDRAGETAFHCPGQLVAYPIMDIKHRVGRLREYIHCLEEVALKTLMHFGIRAGRFFEHPGIWKHGKQIAAIGLLVSRGITMHGLSLNVNPNLNNFKVINLCGLPGKEATSISKLLGHDIDINDVIQCTHNTFSEVFDVDLETISMQQVIGDSYAAESTKVV
ncbi:MAG: lipoyl(octanoyl) transferase LipB [Dehalococcoidia bacterium]|nr:MAG: lipoyl(octanoyl) transferase LipB [Dehalococcoidia bacterium]